jgi:hypothetical protein
VLNQYLDEAVQIKEKMEYPKLANIYKSCPSCDRQTYVIQEGCGTCVSCGFSNCG